MSIAPRGDYRVPSALAHYLKHHHTGAVAGCRLADHVARRTDVDPSVRGLDAEIRRDRDTLETLMDALGVERRLVHQAAARAADVVSMIQISSGRGGRSAASMLLELEALALGIEGKKRLWMSLKLLAGQHAGIENDQLDELLRRADEQLVAVERGRLAAAAQAFGAGQPGLVIGSS